MPFLLDSLHLRRSAASGNPNVKFRGCNHFNQHLTRLQRLLQVTSLRGGASASSCPTPAITRGRTAHVARDDFCRGGEEDARCEDFCSKMLIQNIRVAKIDELIGGLL